jgi:sensor histidine kinase YesM
MIESKTDYYIWKNVLFWFILWTIISGISVLYANEGVLFLVKLIEMPLLIVSTYVFSFAILPFVFKKRYFFFILFCISFAMGYSLLKRLQMQHIVFPFHYGKTGEYTFDFWNWYKILIDLWGFVGVLALFNARRFFNELRIYQERVQALNEEKRSAELSFLKAQIHPHFLFNTLNALYYEVLNKSDVAHELVIKLSEILRFVLYEFNTSKVPLSKEIQLINDYAFLMRSRYGERLTVEISSIEGQGVMVPPLLLFSLVENAFKHGVSDVAESCLITINIETTSNELEMEVINSIAKQVDSNADHFGAKKGIGLINTRRQLELTFENNFELTSSMEDQRYVCKLTIPL